MDLPRSESPSLTAASVAAPRANLRALLLLAWPIVITRATQAIVGFTDALLVAPLGQEPLAAATTGSMNALAAIMLPMGTVFIVQSFAAQLRGRGALDAVRRYALYGLSIALGAGLLSAAVIPFIPGLLGQLEYAPGVRDHMTTYLSIRLLSVGAAVGMEAFGNWYGGLGNTRLPMVAGVVTMVANVAGDWLLIEPRLGLPGYGVAGAAWASVGATWLGFGVLGWAFAKNVGHGLAPGPLGFRLEEFWRVLRFGLPNGVNWFLEFAAFIIYINVVVAHLGTPVLAAFNVVMQINSISFMPAFGVASAGAILVGETIGARGHDAVSAIVKRTALTTGAWMGTVGLAYLIAPQVLVGWFLPPEERSDALLAAGITMLAMSVLWQLFDALGMTLSEALRAAGDTTWCMFARIVLAWVVFTPIAWAAVLIFDGGVVVMMASLVVYMMCLAGAFVYRFLSGKWRRIEMIGEVAS